MQPGPVAACRSCENILNLIQKPQYWLKGAKRMARREDELVVQEQMKEVLMNEQRQRAILGVRVN